MTGLSRVKTDPKKENEGVMVKADHWPNDDGTIPEFMLTRTSKSNTAYTKALAAAVKPYSKLIQLGAMSNDKSDEIMLDVFLKHVLKGWTNVQNDDGTPRRYTEAEAKALLTEQPDVYAWLEAEANSAANFYIDRLETQAKN